MQLSFFDPVDKSVPGALWWDENWQCRNWKGYYNVREGGKGPWQFIIYAFGEGDAVIYRLDHAGKLYRVRVPMDEEGCLIIEGKRYGRSRWQH